MKAVAFAEALGLRLGPVTAIREPSHADHGSPRPLLAMRAMAAEQVSVDPGELTVDAAVEVTFRLEG